MMLATPRYVALAVIVSAVTGYGYQTPSQTRPWPPGIQKISSAAPVLTPAEALTTFSMPPRYRLELVASEPMIQDPILIEWDASGRLWAIELPGYMRDIMASGELEPTGRIVVLEDTNRDGAMDKRTVFADRLIQPRALIVLEHGVLVGEPPNIWLMKDTDGDMRADNKELAATGYGRLETNVEVNANGLLWALDNRMYTSGIGADMYLRLKNGKIESHPSLSRGQWGLTQDDAGRVYRNHNESALHVDVVPTPYFARNPNVLRTRGSHENLTDVNGDVNRVWPSRETPGTNRAYQQGILRENGTLAAFTAACAPTVFRGDRLPADLYGSVFVAEPAGNLVGRLVLNDDGTMLGARKAYEQAEFLTSTDERFRPVHLSSAPDGTLYVVDMYRGLVQHRAYITEYLRDQIVARQLAQPIGFGRIYRVVHETTRRDLTPGLSSASAAQLVETLSHPNGWWRDTAQQLLVERAQRVQGVRDPVVAALGNLVVTGRDWRTRLHALWTLDGIDAVEPALVTKALDDVSRDVRVAAVRIAERWLGEANHPMHAAVGKRLDDTDWAVRRQLAASLGMLPAGPRQASLISLLEHHADDPIVVDAALSGLRGSEAAVLEKLVQGSANQTPHLDAAIAMVAATVVRSGQESAVQSMFVWAADSDRPRWQRSALLRGAEIALLGATMPGSSPTRLSSPAAGTATVPCPTCPGGRGGPGGAYAFPGERVPPVGAAGRGTARSAGPALRLDREPVALSGWAAQDSDMGPRVASVLARVTWPGKRDDAAPIPALTSAEQQRFDAGREIYQNICQACHQPNGRGQDKLAPSLIGSPLTLAPPEVPARILLNGKEGATGLMPPIGSALTDDQMANVLTYVRREWGQPGTPVDAATVTKIRALTAGRTRPWTDAELAAIAQGLGSR